jgi:hypothetical protein
MKDHSAFRHVPRRSFLAGVGTTAAGVFLSPLFASAAGATPNRLLIVHRPCGSRPEFFFPVGGTATSFTLPSILSPFESLKADMAILNGVWCPRDHEAAGDQHGAGMITMMSGRKPIEIPGTNSGGDQQAKNQMAAGPTIDQQLLAKPAAGLSGTSTPSIQSTAYRPSSLGLPNFKVMSYDSSGALFPESRPGTLFNNLFAAAMPNLTGAELERMRLQNQGVLDFVNKDLTRLRGLVPRSQLQKLDAHLDGLSKLQAKLVPVTSTTPGAVGAAACAGPMQAALPAQTGDLTIDEAQHKAVGQNQLAIILAAFQCDLTRVATFTFAHGNSALRFGKIIPNFNDSSGLGHHDLSHVQTPASWALDAQIDQFYSQQLADLLTKMKATPDGDGTLLDHTLVVYFNEAGIGWSHSIENMPVLMFGGKSLKLQTGRHIQYQQRYMSDVWAAVGQAFGVPMPTFGDTNFSKGPVTGLFA